ncbi:MAG: hypothetical protein KZQ87_17875, partial [Candidatus Thiodiazotropha sp. (ex Cardiolucina cf. quadrata)]|nr:hypothetical protein [Candidatus Thiodiazotropha sp. (ex Cardiolucina cf. quadrata)]
MPSCCNLFSRLLDHKASLLFGSLLLISCSASALEGFDIRAASPFTSQQTSSGYILSLSDCVELKDVRIDTGSELVSLLPADASGNPGSQFGCEFSFNMEGAVQYEPAITASYIDGSTTLYSEHFSVETNKPSISLESIAVSEVDGKQFLVANLDASDDTDLSYLSIRLTGIRASDLRKSGGVIQKARESAFLDSAEAVRVWPQHDEQVRFTFSQEIDQPLTPEEIARNALVILEARAVDASGNQQVISDIKYLGSTVDENINGFSAFPESLLFSDVLQSARIIPTLDYEFRGPTPVPGIGQGISYSSADPSSVLVTAEGVVYPLQETGGATVDITVSFPGQDNIIIPVTVDFNRQLVGLEYVGQEQGPFELQRLNEFIGLPPLIAVFDDVSEAPLNDSVEVVYALPDFASGILFFDEQQGVSASALITDANPLSINAHLLRDPSIEVAIPIVSNDAPPEIAFQLPKKISVGETLILKAQAEDDLGIEAVEFWLEGQRIGRRLRIPYELSLPITQDMEGKQLVIWSIAYDSAGQAVRSVDQQVIIEEESTFELPNFKFEKPINSQRIIESTPYLLQVVSDLGEDGDASSKSGISYIEFFSEGRKISESYFSFVEERPNPSNPKKTNYFEVWRTRAETPSISTDESSFNVYARIYSRGSHADSDVKLVRVLKNEQPIVNITSPVPGASATVGQQLDITVEAADDVLAAGTAISLLVNDEVVDNLFYQDTETRDSGSFNYQVHQHTFRLDVKDEWQGSTLNLRAKAVDFHQTVSHSEVLRIPVKGDQAPTVAVSHPAEGAHLVSGLPVELRANATDDLSLSHVSFYVNDNLVGTAHRAPYAFLYQTQENITGEQPLTIHAVAFDSAGQSATSNQVNVTLGQDEQLPVVNIASPPINESDAGDDIAAIVEESQFVFKVTGYDNVGVEELELTGIRKIDGQGYLLTGNSTDILSGVDFPPQAIPGALKAFSALKLVSAPAFRHLDSVNYDRYPVVVRARDKTGNTSEAQFIIGVYADQPPVIRAVTANQTTFYNSDELRLDVVARDDRFLASVHLDMFVDAETSPRLSLVRDDSNGFIQTPELVERMVVPLADLGLSNTAHNLRAVVTVADDQGQESAPFELSLDLIADAVTPNVAITNPIQNSNLFAGSRISVELSAADETGIRSLQVSSGGVSLYQQSYSTPAKTVEESFTYQVPADSGELVLELTAEDIHGNQAPVTNWRYNIVQNDPPQLEIRSPAPGSRLVEGELFNINFSVTDDQSVARVEVFFRDGASEQVIGTMNSRDINEDQEAGAYSTISVRVPHLPDSSTGMLGVRAVDSTGLIAEVDLEIEILNDEEAPTVVLSDQIDPFSILPGESFELEGTVSDNIYVNEVEP